MPDQLAEQWLVRIKQTIATDLSRLMAAQVPPQGIVKRLFEIPEVEQAFHLRADRKRPLAKDPSSRAEYQEIADALTRVANWLDDGFHVAAVEELRSIRDELPLE